MPGSKTKGVTEFCFTADRLNNKNSIVALVFDIFLLTHMYQRTYVYYLHFYGYFYFCLVSIQIQNLSICHVVNVTFIKIKS